MILGSEDGLPGWWTPEVYSCIVRSPRDMYSFRWSFASY